MDSCKFEQLKQKLIKQNVTEEDASFLNNIPPDRHELLILLAVKYNAFNSLQELNDQNIDYQYRIDKKNSTLLHLAALNGYWETFKLILDSEQNKENKQKFLNSWVDNKANTPLHLAAIHGHANIFQNLAKPEHKYLRELVDHKQNVNNRTSLHIAASNGHWETFKSILDNEDNEKNKRNLLNNLVDNNGNTPLHLAAIHGHANIFQNLAKPEYSHLRKLVNWKQYNNDGRQIVHQAARSVINQPNMTLDAIDQISRRRWRSFNWLRRSLLRQKDKTPRRATPAHYAASNTQQGDSITRKLKKKLGLGFRSFFNLFNPFEAKDKFNKTPIEWADNKKNHNVVNYLAKQKVSIQSIITQEDTCFHKLIRNKYYAIMQDEQVPINKINHKDENNGNKTPLHLAIELGDFKAFSRLINKMNEVQLQSALNIQDNNGDTPTHYLARDQELIKNIRSYNTLLFESNSIYEYNNNNKSALHIAAETGNYKFFNTILNNIFTPFPYKDPIRELFRPTENNKISLLKSLNYDNVPQEIIQGLLTQPQLIETPGSNIFHWSAEQGLWHIFSQLIDCLHPEEQSVYLNKKDKQGNTPLHLAAYHEQTEFFNNLQTRPDLIQKIQWLNQFNNAGKHIGHVDAEQKNPPAQNCIKQYQDYQKQLQPSMITKCLQYPFKNTFHNKDTSLDERNENFLHWAVEQQNWEAFKKYIEDSDNETISKEINRPNQEGNTPLHLAAKQGYHDLFTHLKEQHPDVLKQVNWSIANKEGYNITTMAAFAKANLVNTLKSIKELKTFTTQTTSWFQFFQDNSNPLVQLDKNGKSVLHYLVENSQDFYYEVLGERKLFSVDDLQIENSEGQTPLDILNSRCKMSKDKTTLNLS